MADLIATENDAKKVINANDTSSGLSLALTKTFLTTNYPSITLLNSSSYSDNQLVKKSDLFGPCILYVYNTGSTNAKYLIWIINTSNTVRLVYNINLASGESGYFYPEEKDKYYLYNSFKIRTNTSTYTTLSTYGSSYTNNYYYCAYQGSSFGLTIISAYNANSSTYPISCSYTGSADVVNGWTIGYSSTAPTTCCALDSPMSVSNRVLTVNIGYTPSGSTGGSTTYTYNNIIMNVNGTSYATLSNHFIILYRKTCTLSGSYASYECIVFYNNDTMTNNSNMYYFRLVSNLSVNSSGSTTTYDRYPEYVYKAISTAIHGGIYGGYLYAYNNNNVYVYNGGDKLYMVNVDSEGNSEAGIHSSGWNIALVDSDGSGTTASSTYIRRKTSESNTLYLGDKLVTTSSYTTTMPTWSLCNNFYGASLWNNINATTGITSGSVITKGLSVKFG